MMIFTMNTYFGDDVRCKSQHLCVQKYNNITLSLTTPLFIAANEQNHSSWLTVLVSACCVLWHITWHIEAHLANDIRLVKISLRSEKWDAQSQSSENPFHYPRNITTMVRTVRHDSRGCILDTSREHVHCRFVPTSSHDMMTVVMKFLARSLSASWTVYLSLSLSLHLPRSCQCHCILFVFHVWTARGPSVRTPVNLRSHLYVRTQNVFGNFIYVVFGNH